MNRVRNLVDFSPDDFLELARNSAPETVARCLLAMQQTMVLAASRTAQHEKDLETARSQIDAILGLVARAEEAAEELGPDAAPAVTTQAILRVIQAIASPARLH
jgi:hypothetical protein